ncbi:MAG: hypothetical protein J6U68_04195 [Clostridia bacterium]|nr:hypothetical protein [Clostridia bacterium]
MFDWFWEFLYMLSKTIFRIIDGLILCANKLCGIDTVNFEGEETDFLSFLLFSDEVGFAFKVSAILATILLVFFTVFMIIRTITKDKAEGTPSQIAVKSFKTLLMFFFVPAVMIAFMAIGNEFITALYTATTQSASKPGAFLFCAFAQDGGMLPEHVELFRSGQLSYYDTAEVAKYMNLSEFPFLFSWLAGGVVLFGIGSAMLIFVDRVLSIIILYIVSPFSISSSVLDDGARFKLWRDQFLSKFIMGYGMILAINIYAMVCGLVTNPGFAFFPNEGDEFLDLIMKLLIIAGGALTMQKAMALIGNLVAAGAGSNELRDSAFTMGGLAKMAGGAVKFAGKTAGSIASLPFRPLNNTLNEMKAQKARHRAARWLGYEKDNNNSKSSNQSSEESSGAKNNEKANYGSDPNSTKNAINNEGAFKLSFDGNNANNGKIDNKNNAVANTIQNSGKAENGGGQNEQGNQNNQNVQNNQQKQGGGNK